MTAAAAHEVRVRRSGTGLTLYCAPPCRWRVHSGNDHLLAELVTRAAGHKGGAPGMMPVRADDDVYTPNEVAKLFGVTVPTVIGWARKGVLDFIRTPGGYRRYHAGQVNALLRGGPC